MLIDPYATVHSLARRIEGAGANAVRDKLKDVDRDSLPNVAQARRMQRERNPHLARAAKSTRERDHQPYSPEAPGRQHAPVASPKKAAPRAAQQSLQAATPAIAGPAAVTRSAFNAATKVMDGIASLFEGLLGGGPSQPHRKTEHEARREREIAEQQPTRSEQHEQISIEQKIADIERQRQNFTREYGLDVPLEAMPDHEIAHRQQRERERSR